MILSFFPFDYYYHKSIFSLIFYINILYLYIQTYKLLVVDYFTFFSYFLCDVNYFYLNFIFSYFCFYLISSIINMFLNKYIFLMYLF